jgi:hypothetical protein
MNKKTKKLVLNKSTLKTPKTSVKAGAGLTVAYTNCDTVGGSSRVINTSARTVEC